MSLANRTVPFLLVAAAAMFVRAPFMIEAAPIESTMGVIQKIFYFHVPSAAASFAAAFVCGIASALYLWRRNRIADHFAVSGAELAVVFGLIVLVTGPLWARKAWGVWWQWDVRLTMTLVMWMIFVAYCCCDASVVRDRRSCRRPWAFSAWPWCPSSTCR